MGTDALLAQYVLCIAIPVDGTPQRWAQNWFLMCTYALLAHYLLCIATPVDGTPQRWAQNVFVMRTYALPASTRATRGSSRHWTICGRLALG